MNINITWITQQANDFELYSYSLKLTDKDGIQVLDEIITQDQSYEGLVNNLLPNTQYIVEVNPLNLEEEIIGVPASENICSCNDFSENCYFECNTLGKISK